jgi:hypothetical protein
MDTRLEFYNDGVNETVTCPYLNLSFTQPLYRNGVMRDRMDLAVEAFAYFESKIQMADRRLHVVDRDHKHIMAEMKIELMDGKNWISCPPLFHFSRYPKEHPLPPAIVSIAWFFKSWDYDFFGMNGCYASMEELIKNVFKANYDNKIPGIDWYQTGTP